MVNGLTLILLVGAIVGLGMWAESAIENRTLRARLAHRDRENAVLRGQLVDKSHVRRTR